MTPFFRALSVHNELVEARRDAEPSYHEPPWSPITEEQAQAARDAAAEAAGSGRIEAAEAAWAQIHADYPQAAAAVEAEAEAGM